MGDTAMAPDPRTAPTSHPRLLAWVSEVAALTTPTRVVWCDGSDGQWQEPTSDLPAPLWAELDTLHSRLATP